MAAKHLTESAEGLLEKTPKKWHPHDELPRNYKTRKFRVGLEKKWWQWRARNRAKKRLFESFVNVLHRYQEEKSKDDTKRNEENLQAVTDAKTKYLTFVFFAEGVDAAIREERPRGLYARASEAIADKRRRPLTKKYGRWALGSLVGIIPYVLAGIKGIDYAIKSIGSVGIGAAVGFAVSEGLQRIVMSDNKEFRKVEKEAREKGESYEEFMLTNTRLYRKHIRAKRIARTIGSIAGISVAVLTADWLGVGAITSEVAKDLFAGSAVQTGSLGQLVTSLA